MMISQVMKRYKDFKFSWKSARKTLYLSVLLFLMVFLYRHFTAASYFPITEVKIAGVYHTDHQTMQQSLAPLVHTGFLNVNVERVHDRLLQFPWIKEAYVRRIWPNEITIKVVEKTPVARWNETSLLSSAGEIFSPNKNTFPKNLMAFIGAPGKQIKMIERYAQIDQLLQPLHFKIARFELTPSQVFHITFTNGINLQVEDKDILTRLPHFVKVYPKIVGERAAQVDYVDLRYVNGLAVRWKTIT